MEQTAVEKRLQSLLDHRQSQSLLRRLTVAPPGAPDFSSNDFLSLSTNKSLHTAFFNELSKSQGDFRLGSGGSRLLDGNSSLAQDLERDVALFHNAPAGLLFNSGFDANSGFFACVPRCGDYVVYDSYIHASVHDGMRLSRASSCLPFKHNSVTDLRALLERSIKTDRLLEQGSRDVFLAVEAIYSMDGDLTPLQEIIDLVDQLFPFKNCHIIIDEAHSTGVLGPLGKGLVCQLGLEDRMFARLHTFGKAMASAGAMILCSQTVRQYLINYARPLIYTTSMSYPSLISIKVSYDFLGSGKVEALRRHLQALQTRFYRLLQQLVTKHPLQGTGILPLTIPASCPRSPIFSILTSEPRNLAAHCQKSGFVVRPVVPPTVPTGTERIRVCLHAGNTYAQIDALAAAIELWTVKEMQRRKGLSTCTYADRARL
ncbi:aminotransferase [Pseudovirgaria hyperparasitica]|uniref:Aminotransferase n=1 Tax=Pseudovirgaria hyperparasitica TaxID=470096 RepID=A0A6A6VXJ4_9PEZI|nr:aminotransferase [Pseudovirgaria hyperparasitica]KAF2754526.1 aminotransferase [Pseudovirgaria hyperparasitica]